MTAYYPDLNVELIRRVRKHVVAYPERHNQCSFKSPCGVTQCVAGWALTFSGYASEFDGDGDFPCWFWFDHNGREVVPDTAAREVLGLTEIEANVLFFRMNEVDVVRMLDNLLAGKRGGDACYSLSEDSPSRRATGTNG